MESEVFEGLKLDDSEDYSLPYEILKNIKVMSDGEEVEIPEPIIEEPVNDGPVELNTPEEVLQEAIPEAKPVGSVSGIQETNGRVVTIESRDTFEYVIKAKQNAVLIINNIYSLIRSVPGYQNAYNALNDYIQKAHLKLLNSIPVKCINIPPRGIRVASLQARGYYYLGQLNNVSYDRLMMMPGIGSVSASSILEALDYYRQDAIKSVVIDPGRTPEGVTLVYEYYKYRNLALVFHNSKKKYEAMLKEIEALYEQLTPVETKRDWKFLPKTKKGKMCVTATKINDLLTDELTEKIYADLQLRATILNTNVNGAWEVYSNNKSKYLKELEQLRKQAIIKYNSSNN